MQLRNKKKIIFIAVLVAGMCSIVYELLVSTASTYFLGDGVKQFSLVIGIYLFSLGLGAYLSKFSKTKALSHFIGLEFVLGTIGGISVPLIYFLFIYLPPTYLQFSVLAIVFVIGILSGLEVPLLTYAMRKSENDEDHFSDILSLDYLGGLIATLLFPFLLLPFLGLFYSSLVFGSLNIVLGLYMAMKFDPKNFKVIGLGSLCLVVLLTGVVYTGKILKVWDEKIYKAPIVLNVQTPYQKIVMTQKPKDVRLYLNRVIQFASSDEHRYHESLIHVPFTMHSGIKRVLVLGGGENLASRELLKHSNIELIDVVDIDSTMFWLARNNKLLLEINDGAALNPKVNLIAQDAFTFLHESDTKYDLVIADLPDPANESLARLYSTQFFKLAKSKLNDSGIFVTQAGEIYFSNTVFSCIYNSLNEVFNNVGCYHTYIPSFGDWGFVLASDYKLDTSNTLLPPRLQYLDASAMKNILDLPKDIQIQKTKVNTLDNPVVLQYYLDDWERFKTDLQGN